MVEIEAGGEDWMMENIMASGPSNDNAKQYIILVKWKDYSHNENTWESYDNVMEHDKDLIKKYYEEIKTVERDGRFTKQKIKKRKKTSIFLWLF